MKRAFSVAPQPYSLVSVVGNDGGASRLMERRGENSIFVRMRALGAVLALTALAACAQPLEEAPFYQTADCSRIDLVDDRTGARIIGAEDMALDPSRGRLIVSAYDRRAAEKAAARGDKSVPEGGVYAVQLSDLLQKDDRRVAAQSIVDAGDVTGGLRPHGLDFDAAAGEIAFINRVYERRDGKWRRSARVERIGVDGAVFVGGGMATHCAANDLVADNGATFISHDHGACGWRGAVEDVAGLKRAGVRDGARVLAGNVQFANGLTRLSDGFYALAATREGAVLFFEESEDGLRPAGRIALPGGPDNLTKRQEGGFVAALHPSLPAMGAHRKLGIGRAPSRIVEIDADRKTVRALFDDPKGRLFSGATVAVAEGTWMVAGSATDAGLLLCRKDERAP